MQPRALALGVGHERDVVGIVRGDADLAVRFRGVRPHVVGGEARELARIGELDRAHVVAVVARELLLDEEELVADGPHALPRRAVQLDAGAFHVGPCELERASRDRIERSGIDAAEGVVERTALHEPDLEALSLLHRLLRGLAHCQLRVHLAQERGLAPDVRELEEQLVERLEDALARVRRPGGFETALECRGAAEPLLVARGELFGGGQDGRHSERSPSWT